MLRPSITTGPRKCPHESYLNAAEREAGVADFDYATLSHEDAQLGRQDVVEEKGFFILPGDLFENVRAGASANPNLNETLAHVFTNIEASAVGTSSESDFKGLFEDLDVNSAKLGRGAAGLVPLVAVLAETWRPVPDLPGYEASDLGHR